jgi:hypothetical protein
MAKKKAAPKSAPAKDTPTPKKKRSKADEGDTVLLFIPPTLYQDYLKLGETLGHKAIRDLFDMLSDGDISRYGMIHCVVDSIDNLPPEPPPIPKDPAAKDDDGRDPVKLCDEGGR